ncbi:MAG: TrkH family potassium uptake protein [Desulfonatronovibrio sp.]
MHWRHMAGLLGLLLLFIGLAMLFPLIFSVFHQDAGLIPLFWSSNIIIILGIILHLLFRKHKAEGFSHREGLFIVSAAWICSSLAGSLPFILGGFMDPTDAVFESFSGFTTTGASILGDIEALPPGILMWRSFTHWLGGMGIIVLSLAVLPFLGVGGMQLYKAEVSGPSPDKLKPRISETAMLLWKVYLLFTLVLTLLLLLGGLNLFDSLCQTFGTVATGGFSNKNDSIAHFDSAYVDWIITVFMFLCSVSFALHYKMLTGKISEVWKSPELRFFGVLVVFFISVSAVFIYISSHANIFDALRFSSFQVVSIITTTGFVTYDYLLWPALVQVVLLLCMFIGGCAGSTAGGIKCMRVMLLLKLAYRELFRIVHPHAVQSVKMGKVLVKEDVLSGVVGFIIIFLALMVISSLLIAAMGVDLLTSLTAVLACVSNIGPGFGDVGPASNFAGLPGPAKWILSLCMILGRLEIYTIIVLMVPAFWKK